MSSRGIDIVEEFELEPVSGFSATYQRLRKSKLVERPDFIDVCEQCNISDPTKGLFIMALILSQKAPMTVRDYLSIQHKSQRFSDPTPSRMDEDERSRFSIKRG